MEIQSVISKIRKLMEMANQNTSEVEAINAMDRISELMEVYNVNISDVLLKEQKCVEKPIFWKGTTPGPIRSVIMSLAAFCDCKIWKNYNKYMVFGLETDVDMYEYLYKIIDFSIANETNNFKKTSTYINAYIHRKSIIHSFQTGMTDRLRERLRNMTENRHTKETATTVQTSGQDIVLIKQKKVEDEFEKLNYKLRKTTTYRSAVSSSSSYSSGISSADKVNLSRPISTSNTIKGYLS